LITAFTLLLIVDTLMRFHVQVSDPWHNVNFGCQ